MTMADESYKAAAQLRRDHYVKAINEVETVSRPSLRDKAIDNLREKVEHLLDQLEAAETLPPKAPLTGVWQVELTNGVVHNFVADYCTGGAPSFLTGASFGMVEFVRGYGPEGKSRSVTVLAVRSEKVIAYRRLDDWHGDEELAMYSLARWATASPGDSRPKSPTLPFGAYGVTS
jgi:hypothetical protein